MEARKWRRVSIFSSCLSLFPMGWVQVWDWLLNDVVNYAVKRVLENGAATDISNDQMLWDAQHSQAKVYHIEISTALVPHLTQGEFWGRIKNGEL